MVDASCEIGMWTHRLDEVKNMNSQAIHWKEALKLSDHVLPTPQGVVLCQKINGQWIVQLINGKYTGSMAIYFGRGYAASFSTRSGTKEEFEEQRWMLLDMLEYLLADEQIPRRFWEDLVQEAVGVRMSLSSR